MTERVYPRLVCPDCLHCWRPKGETGQLTDWSCPCCGWVTPAQIAEWKTKRGASKPEVSPEEVVQIIDSPLNQEAKKIAKAISGEAKAVRRFFEPKYPVKRLNVDLLGDTKDISMGCGAPKQRCKICEGEEPDFGPEDVTFIDEYAEVTEEGMEVIRGILDGTGAKLRFKPFRMADDLQTKRLHNAPKVDIPFRLVSNDSPEEEIDD